VAEELLLSLKVIGGIFFFDLFSHFMNMIILSGNFLPVFVDRSGRVEGEEQRKEEY